MLFELEQAWPAINHGAIAADDIHQNAAFMRFTASALATGSYVVPADDGGALFGIALK